MKKIFFYTILFLVSHNIKSQETKKDTLFFSFDESYILKTEATGADYVLLDSNKDGTFYFERAQSIQSLNPKEILCLKNYVRTSEFFRKGWKRELRDYSLWEHFEKYIIFLVKKEKNSITYIQVEPIYIIE